MEDITKFTKFSPVLPRIWYIIWFVLTAQGGLVLPPTTLGRVSEWRREYHHTRVTWAEARGRIVASVSTGQHSTGANFKTFLCSKSTSGTLVRIRGGERMTILTSRGWRRGGWSPLAAWRAWTRWRGWTSGMTPGLGLETGGFDGGVVTKILPPFF